jgi:hypothetical protein
VSGGLAVLEAFHQWIKLNEYSVSGLLNSSHFAQWKNKAFFVSISASKWQASNRNQIGL